MFNKSYEEKLERERRKEENKKAREERKKEREQRRRERKIAARRADKNFFQRLLTWDWE